MESWKRDVQKGSAKIMLFIVVGSILIVLGVMLFVKTATIPSNEKVLVQLNTKSGIPTPIFTLVKK